MVPESPREQILRLGLLLQSIATRRELGESPDVSEAILWQRGVDGATTFMSRGWTRYTGQAQEQALGAGWLAAIHPQDRARARDGFLAALRANEPFAVDYRLRRADGEYRWVMDSGRPRHAEKGELLGYVGSIVDVHELSLAGEAVRESEARKSAMFDTALDCIISIDHEGTVVEFNPAAERTFGYRRDEALGRELAALIIPPALREQHRQGLARYLATGEGPVLGRRIELNAMHAGGGEFPVELAVTRIPTAGPALFTAYLRDITERKRTEQALREADLAKDEFLATLSHELRNPLAPLRNALELLRRAGAGGSVAHAIQAIMERQVNHLVRLVDDLMELSRITRGSFALRREPLELQAVLRNALETAKPLIDAAEHRLEVRMPREPLHLEADAVRLAQVFSNLLNNAAKYTPAGGAISLEARREGPEAVVQISDTGEGIDAAQLPHLFEMFRQADRTSRRSQSGLGIGLALAKRLAEMHSGSVEAQSAGLGKGSRFTVRLPLGAPARPAASAPPQPVPLAPTRVLVVDDNRDAATTLGMLLNFLGADVRVAHDGPAALAAFDAYRPAIVLLDIGMPGMDGYEVARAIRGRASAARVPLVALTGWGQAEDRKRAAAAGFDHHLVKPADIEALQALLASLS